MPDQKYPETNETPDTDSEKAKNKDRLSKEKTEQEGKDSVSQSSAPPITDEMREAGKKAEQARKTK